MLLLILVAVAINIDKQRLFLFVFLQILFVKQLYNSCYIYITLSLFDKFVFQLVVCF